MQGLKWDENFRPVTLDKEGMKSCDETKETKVKRWGLHAMRA